MEELITYAHKDDPLGSRFRALKRDPVPDWAVDVQDEAPPVPPSAHLNHMKVQVQDGVVVIQGRFQEEGGPLVYCYPDGRFELFEVPQYGGEERSYGEFPSIQAAFLVADSWT